MPNRTEQGRIISIGSLILFLLAGISLWLVGNTSGTWGYFSNTLQELATISTGYWEMIPGQAGTSITATKTAEGFWLDFQDAGVRGEVCVSNTGERPTDNLSIEDLVQIKFRGLKFENYKSTSIDVASNPVLDPGESHCYPYELDFMYQEGANFRNVAVVTITNHSGWIPGGHNCPGPETCPFGPQPKAGFDIPPPPDPEGGNISSPQVFLPDTGLPQDADPEGKLFEIPPVLGTSPPADAVEPTATVHVTEPPLDEGQPAPTVEVMLPTPTLAPTQNVSIYPTLPPAHGNESTPTLAPTAYAGPAGCTRPLEYWLEHPNKWSLDRFVLGNETLDKQQALDLLATLPQGDASFILAQQYITAQLNFALPADPTEVAQEIQESMDWFVSNPPGSKPGNPDRKLGLQLAGALEEYNSGKTGPGACSSDAPAPTPTPMPTPTSTNLPTPTLAPTMEPTSLPTPAPTPTLGVEQGLPTPARTP